MFLNHTSIVFFTWSYNIRVLHNVLCNNERLFLMLRNRSLFLPRWLWAPQAFLSHPLLAAHLYSVEEEKMER